MSFSRAADELSVTQSAVSRHIKNLEAFLQKQLFVRRGRSVLLSPEGQKYFDNIKVSFSLIEEATKLLAASGNESTLTINVLPTLGMRWLAPRLHQFSQQCPDIEIHLITSIEPVALASGEVDLAIRVGELEPESATRKTQACSDLGADRKLARVDLEMLDSWEGVATELLFADILVAVYNPHLIDPPTSPRYMNKYVLIVTNTRAGAWDDWFSIGGLQPLQGCRKLSFGHFFMSMQAAIEGKGIAILPEVLIEQELASGTLKRLFHKAESAGKYYLLFRRDDMEKPRVAQFRRWISGESAAYRKSRIH